MTLGAPEVTALDWLSEPQIKLLEALNARGSHPLNAALAEHLSGGGSLPEVKRFKAVPGKGIQGKIEGELYFLGAPHWYREITGKVHDAKGTTALFFTESSLLAAAQFEDTLDPSAGDALKLTVAHGATNVLVSGDHSSAVQRTAAQLGIEAYYAEKLPTEKVEVVKAYQSKGSKTLVAMVGDGINDTAALSAAHVGISFAAASAAAQHSADVVIMKGHLQSLPVFYALAKQFKWTVRGNLLWAFGYNVVAIPIAAGLFYPVFGWQLSPMVASVAMSFSSLGVVANSLLVHLRKL